ncbi:MAG TPA: hypothetical protein PLX83_21535 [bacterium]|nr:hypothetical protein [bacterium]
MAATGEIPWRHWSFCLRAISFFTPPRQERHPQAIVDQDKQVNQAIS